MPRPRWQTDDGRARPQCRRSPRRVGRPGAGCVAGRLVRFSGRRTPCHTAPCASVNKKRVGWGWGWWDSSTVGGVGRGGRPRGGGELVKGLGHAAMMVIHLRWPRSCRCPLLCSCYLSVVTSPPKYPYGSVLSPLIVPGFRGTAAICWELCLFPCTHNWFALVAKFLAGLASHQHATGLHCCHLLFSAVTQHSKLKKKCQQ